MTTLSDLADVLPESTRNAWKIVADLNPSSGILMGGTGLAVHLRHRTSRDLDVFTSEPFDVDLLERSLGERALFATTSKGDGYLNGILAETKAQFLWAEGQRVLHPSSDVEGLAVGSLPDIAATKLKAIGDRGALRDYFDLWCTEEQAGLRVEEIVGLYIERYQVSIDDSSIAHIVGALGYFEDVGDDPGLPVGRDDIVSYWQGRQPQIVRALSANS